MAKGYSLHHLVDPSGMGYVHIQIYNHMRARNLSGDEFLKKYPKIWGTLNTLLLLPMNRENVRYAPKLGSVVYRNMGYTRVTIYLGTGEDPYPVASVVQDEVNKL